ncbi:MAG: SGNH/GDSL hydrolase family protein [Oscillospiraceae bacterium]
MVFDKGDKVVFIGDSVTDCGRSSDGEGMFGDIGKGYVGYISGLMESIYPQQRIRIINKGTGGNRITHLKERWQQDVIDLNPDWVCVMIGINDVWRNFDLPLITELHVSLEEYTTILEELVKTTLPKVKGMILMTPYYMEPNKEEPLRKAMDSYGKAVKTISEKYKTLYIDTQAAFDQLFAHLHPTAISWDRIHPHTTGHMTIAKAVLDRIGFEWNR